MQILTNAHWSGILLLVNWLEKLKNPKPLPENSPWYNHHSDVSDYDALLRKSGKVIMEIKRLRLNTIIPLHRQQKPKSFRSRSGTNSQKTLNQIDLIPNLKNILTLGSDLNVDVMCAWIFETLSVKMCANHLLEGYHVF